MDKVYARKMSELTSDFYQRVSGSFSATRKAPWRGWSQVLELCENDSDPLRVLDVACGNLRFERFLSARECLGETWAVDNCIDLMGDGLEGVHCVNADVAEALLQDDPSFLREVMPCDLSVSFGFAHHLPLFEQRVRLMRLLVRHTLPGGHVAVAFWQFADDERLRAKAKPVPGGKEGDYLLGWQDAEGVYRFCHHCAEAEIDGIVRSVSNVALETSRFFADGKSGRMNRYVVLRVL